jgi:hypothetical protein
MRKLLQGSLAAFATVAFATVALAEGNLAKTPATKVTIEIKGKPGAAGNKTVDVETGKYYNLVITSDGGDEVLFTAPAFFDGVYVNQIVVNGAEVKMFGTGFKGVEIGEDRPNEVSITFVAIKPADYPFLLNGKAGGTLHVH